VFIRYLGIALNQVAFNLILF